MSIQSQEIFIESIKGLDSELTDIGFSHLSTTKKGYATYIDYKSADNSIITFMYGPSDWDVEILIIKNGKKYALKDILQVPSITQWIKDNKFQEQTRNRIKDEVAWFVDLIRFIIKTRPLTD